jgi:hypothetical protein
MLFQTNGFKYNDKIELTEKEWEIICEYYKRRRRSRKGRPQSMEELIMAELGILFADPSRGLDYVEASALFQQTTNFTVEVKRRTHTIILKKILSPTK